MDDTECMICLEPFNDSTVAILKCKHIYHYECLKKWINKNNPEPDISINQHKLCAICETENEILTIFKTNNISIDLKNIEKNINSDENDSLFNNNILETTSTNNILETTHNNNNNNYNYKCCCNIL